MPDMQISQTGEELRRTVRAGLFDGQTAGQAPDCLQGNVVMLPKAYAADFLRFCLNNPKPCPLIGLSEIGIPALPSLGSDIDIRRDVPRYRVHRDGMFYEERTDVADLWTDDLVTFVLGCSFTFEEALMREGYSVRHVEQGRNVPMFRTALDTVPAGVFSGPLVVTMRPFAGREIAAVFDVCSRYPHAHGAPIAWGDPAILGIADLNAPDYGDAVELREGDVPVYWACGVTPQAAIAEARPPLCITHAPGCMLVTDIPSDQPPDVDISLARFVAR